MSSLFRLMSLYVIWDNCLFRRFNDSLNTSSDRCLFTPKVIWAKRTTDWAIDWTISVADIQTIRYAINWFNDHFVVIFVVILLFTTRGTPFATRGLHLLCVQYINTFVAYSVPLLNKSVYLRLFHTFYIKLHFNLALVSNKTHFTHSNAFKPFNNQLYYHLFQCFYANK